MKNIILSVLAAAGLCTACTSQKEVKVLSPEEFGAAVKADPKAVVLDVRRPDEFAEGHLDKAVNLNWLNQKEFTEGLQRLSKDRNYYAYCRSGKRSNAATTKMQGEGFKVYDMAGGYLRWTSEGRPVVKGGETVDFTVARNYFYAGKEQPASLKFTTEDDFRAHFGMAPVMGKNGEPTKIDFQKQFAIAMVVPATEYDEEIAPISLTEAGDKTLLLTYKHTKGEKRSFTVRPCFIIVVDREYADWEVKTTL